MPSTNEYLNYVLNLLNNVQGITYKKMMGEYLLYKDMILFGGIYDNRFLIKKTKSICDYGLKEEIPYKGAKPMYLINLEDLIEIEGVITILLNDLKK